MPLLREFKTVGDLRKYLDENDIPDDAEIICNDERNAWVAADIEYDSVDNELWIEK